MRTLSATLLAAQKAASREPYFKVTLSDRDVGVARLRWERWYTGSENAGPCRVASPADGSLLRARLDGTTLYHQRVTTPGPGSTYSSWTNLGTVAAAPRLGLAAAGTRAMIAFVNSAGTGVSIRESTNSGASFGGSTVLATAAAAVTAIACTLQADGSAVVFWGVGAAVWRIKRTGTGAWGAATQWTQTLTAVGGLAAYFDQDHCVLVSGASSTVASGVWATIFGAGGQVATDTWTGLTEVAGAATGTNVTYLATGVGKAEVPRCAIVEAYTGGGAYQRAHLGSMTEGAIFFDQQWREPLAFGFTGTHGLGFWGSATDAWLAAPNGVWHATVTVTNVDLTADVLDAEMLQGLDEGRLRLVLRNDDGRYNAGTAPLALASGGQLAVEPGYRTTVGLESSAGPVFWITSVRRSRKRGVAVAEVEAADGWGVLEAFTMPRQQTWAINTLTVFDIMNRVCRLAGLRLSYAGSTEAGVLKPAAQIQAGDSAASGVRRLRERVADEVRMKGTAPLLFEPTAAQAVDYAYGTDHAIEELGIADERSGVGWARVFGVGVFAQAVDDAQLLLGATTALVVDENLTAQARADVRAATVLRRRALAVPRGELAVPPNVGQEAGDVVSVTDAGLGLSAAPLRVESLRLRYSRTGARGGEYSMRLGLVTR